MATTRYPQFCALARAAEILGERWTLLILRELLLGPKRFSDLRAALDGISSSVLSERLARAEKLRLVCRSVLEPPAASTVYELTEHGLALKPAVFELIRWGGRFLFPARRGERVEPGWMRLALAACARRGESPPRSFLIRIRNRDRETTIHVAGGPTGTSVTDRQTPADVTLVADVKALLSLMGGAIRPSDALRDGRIQAQGDLAALAVFPQLFDLREGGGTDPAGDRTSRGTAEART